MLLRFSAENWKSISDETEIYAFPGKTRGFRNSIAKVSRPDCQILPVMAIYGGNASGKSNLIKALGFVKDLILEKKTLRDREPFRLDEKRLKAPSRFSITFLTGSSPKEEKVFEFTFAITNSEVVEERLAEIQDEDEKLLYDRFESSEEPNVENENSLGKTLDFLRLHPVKDRLWFTDLLRFNIFPEIHFWFRFSLQFITPETRTVRPYDFFRSGEAVPEAIQSLTQSLDLGIDGVKTRTISSENVDFPEDVKRFIRENMEPGKPVFVVVNESGSILEVSCAEENGNWTVRELVTRHKTPDGREVSFQLKDESDGTRRIIGIAPAWKDLNSVETRLVLVIDELDRSLHTLLTRSLLQSFQNSRTPQARNQLIFTTHDVMLMDAGLLRKDEMWLVDRTAEGATQLSALVDFPQKKKNLRKDYLMGRFGGIPRIFLAPFFQRDEVQNDEENEES